MQRQQQPHLDGARSQCTALSLFRPCLFSSAVVSRGGSRAAGRVSLDRWHRGQLRGPVHTDERTLGPGLCAGSADGRSWAYPPFASCVLFSYCIRGACTCEPAVASLGCEHLKEVVCFQGTLALTWSTRINCRVVALVATCKASRCCEAVFLFFFFYLQGQLSPMMN